MATEDAGLAKPTPLGPNALAGRLANKQYQQLLKRCQEICEGARQSSLRYMWTLGQLIAKELPEDRQDHYGQELILFLERDLAIDRTTLWRAVQTFESFALEDILDGSSRMLTWGKLRMLLPLPADMRDRIMERIRAGKLRTDDEVRLAIHMEKEKLGMLPAGATAELRGHMKGLSKNDLDALDRAWKRAQPEQRCILWKTFIPKLGLETIPRRQALTALNEIGREIEAYRQEIEEAAQ